MVLVNIFVDIIFYMYVWNTWDFRFS